MMYKESMLQAGRYRTGSGGQAGLCKPVFLNSLEERTLQTGHPHLKRACASNVVGIVARSLVKVVSRCRFGKYSECSTAMLGPSL
jgi:hypothetical protein